MSGENLPIDQGADEPVQFTKKAKSNSGEKGHIDMTPMVDVVFQLLTFFLLAVKRDTQKPLDVPIVTRSTTKAEAESTFITIKAATGNAKEPTIILGDKRSGEGENITPEKLKAELEQAVAGGRAVIIVKAERLVPHGEVLKICRIVASVEGALLHVGVQTKE